MVSPAPFHKGGNESFPKVPVSLELGLTLVD